MKKPHSSWNLGAPLLGSSPLGRNFIPKIRRLFIPALKDPLTSQFILTPIRSRKTKDNRFLFFSFLFYWIKISQLELPKEYDGLNGFFTVDLLNHSLSSFVAENLSGTSQWNETFITSTSEALQLTDEDVLIIKLKHLQENRAKAFSRVFGICKLKLSELLVGEDEVLSYEGWVTLVPEEKTITNNANEMVGSALESMTEWTNSLKLTCLSSFSSLINILLESIPLS